MKTKAEIVERLLREGKIDASEAVVLLMADSPTQPIYVGPVYPTYPTNPFYPWQPLGPFYYQNTITVGTA